MRTKELAELAKELEALRKEVKKLKGDIDDLRQYTGRGEDERGAIVAMLAVPLAVADAPK